MATKRTRTTKKNSEAKPTETVTAQVETAAATAPAPKAATPKKEAATATVNTRAVDIQEEIRTRAYHIYEQRGREHGYDFDDWLLAESEVLSRFGARSA